MMFLDTYSSYAKKDRQLTDGQATQQHKQTQHTWEGQKYNRHAASRLLSDPKILPSVFCDWELNLSLLAIRQTSSVQGSRGD